MFCQRRCWVCCICSCNVTGAEKLKSTSVTEVKSPINWLICGWIGWRLKNVRFSVNVVVRLQRSRVAANSVSSAADGVTPCCCQRCFTACHSVLPIVDLKVVKCGVSGGVSTTGSSGAKGSCGSFSCQ